MKRGEGKKVYVGMSGGVDSSLSAALIRDAGYDVTGVYLRGWEPEGFPCSQTEDRADAMRVAAQLGVAFMTLDLSRLYKKEVIDAMLAGYARGETPNPDILCNKYIKFGAFFDEAMRLGADYVATGHYARVIEKNGTYELHAGADETKDQSYFLWTLTSLQLEKTLFPIGGMKKSQVRAQAHARGLATAHKRDSQGLCFLGSIDVKEFLSRELGSRRGVVLDEQGETIGEHPGAHLFTLGERHGFTNSSNAASRGPLYVVRKDVVENTLTVAPAQVGYERAGAKLHDVNWIGGIPPVSGRYFGRFRYRQELMPFDVNVSGKSVRVAPATDLPHQLPLGQSLVFYDGTRCLGGGILER